MKSKRAFLLIIVFVFSPIFIFPSTIIKPDSLLHSLDLSEEDAIILDESNSIMIEGQKAGFINFTVTKELRVKVLSEKGREKYSSFSLPEKFDPTYVAHFPEARNYTNALTEIFTNSFQASIINEAGIDKPAIVNENTKMVQMVDVMTNYYGNYKQPCFNISNLAIGDELIISYSYYVRYHVNILALSSFRVFFNSDIYKENYQLQLSHHEDLEINISYINGANPDTSYLDDKIKVYKWHKKDLVDCIDEAGSRPYKELPHLIFSITPYELLYTYYFSFEERFIPFYALYALVREEEHVSIAKSVHQGVTNSQYSQVNKFIKSQTKDIVNDTLGYEKLKKIHHTIADEFAFANDTDYFKKIDTRRPRFGDYTTKRTIRDISRYDIYACLIMKLDLPYFTAYVCDNRVGAITDEYFAPMKDNDYFFAVVLENNTVQYIHPKNSRYGYLLNEYPFYYEKSPARLVCLDDYRDYKSFIDKELRQINLPHSTIIDNQRRTNAMVQVNIDSALVDFKLRMNVSGQYSTMSRGLYQYDIKDKTVNDLYNTKVWELNENVTAQKPKVEVLKDEFPFNTRITVDYSSNDILSIKDDTISLQLNNMFNHIIYKDFSPKNRQLTFFSDFRGQDVYVYYLKLDEDVQLAQEFEDIDIINDYGELKISIMQLDPRSIKISSSFTVKKEMLKAADIDQVKVLYDEIQKLNTSNLKLTLVKE